jgi:heat shock protein HslJ
MNKTILPLLALLALAFVQCSKNFALPFGEELKVTQLLGQTVPAATGMMLKFDEAEKRITGKAGCNNFNAPFELKGSKLTFGNGISTKMTCPNQEWEDKFMSILPQVASIKQVGNKLQLFDSAGKALAALSK